MLRYRIPSSFQDVVFTAREAFSKRSWPYVLATVVPWLLLGGQRCVTRLAALASHRRSLSAYYRFLSRGKWRIETLFHCLFDLIVRTFPRSGPLLIAVDDTLVPKWGHGIFGTASFFDHAQRPRAGFIWGHNWVVLAVVVQFGAHGWVALPFWISLYRPESTCDPGHFRTRLEMTVQALQTVRTWYSKGIRLLADGAYNNASIVKPIRAMDIHLVSRLRSDARLRTPAPPKRRKKKRGRPAKYGAWLPRLRAMARSRQAFRPLRVNIYGKNVNLLVREVVAYWPALGCKVKVVITRDPKNAKRLAYLMTTDLTMGNRTLIEDFSKRWSIEQLFSIMKGQLGFDSAEVRTERSVTRHAAFTMALATWTTIWIHRHRPSARGGTFSRQLKILREDIVKQTIFQSGPRTQASGRIATGMATLFSVATTAA